VAAALAAVESRVEPDLYMWGAEIREHEGHHWARLQTLRDEIEPGLKQQTEPDICLRFADWGWLLIEAKFGSPITTYDRTPGRVDEWIERYCHLAPELLDPEGLRLVEGKAFPEQLLRNLVFARQLAEGTGNAVVVALTRERDRQHTEGLVHRCLRPPARDRFRAASWEQLHGSLGAADPVLEPLREYLRRKSLNLRPAFGRSNV